MTGYHNNNNNDNNISNNVSDGNTRGSNNMYTDDSDNTNDSKVNDIEPSNEPRCNVNTNDNPINVNINNVNYNPNYCNRDWDTRSSFQQPKVLFDCLLVLIGNNKYYARFESALTESEIIAHANHLPLPLFPFIERSLDTYCNSQKNNIFERFECNDIDVSNVNLDEKASIQYIACMIDFIWFFKCQSHSQYALSNAGNNLDQIITYCNQFMPGSIEAKLISQMVSEKSLISLLLHYSTNYDEFEYYKCYYNILSIFIKHGINYGRYNHYNFSDIVDSIENVYLNVFRNNDKISIDQIMKQIKAVNELHRSNEYVNLSELHARTPSGSLYPREQLIFDKITSIINDVCFKEILNKFMSMIDNGKDSANAKTETASAVNFLLRQIIFPLMSMLDQVRTSNGIYYYRGWEMEFYREKIRSLVKSIMQLYYHPDQYNMEHINIQFILLSNCLSYMNDEKIFEFKYYSHWLIQHMTYKLKNDSDNPCKIARAFNSRHMKFLVKLFSNHYEKHICAMMIEDRCFFEPYPCHNTGRQYYRSEAPFPTPKRMKYMIKIYLIHSKSYLTMTRSQFESETPAHTQSTVIAYLVANIYDDIMNECICEQIKNAALDACKDFMNIDTDLKDIVSIIKSYTQDYDLSIYFPTILTKDDLNDIETRVCSWFNQRGSQSGNYVESFNKWLEYLIKKLDSRN